MNKRWLVATLIVFGVTFAGLSAAIYVEHRAAQQLPYHDRFATRGLKGWQSLGGDWVASSDTVMNDSGERGAKLLFGSDEWSDYSLAADVEVLGPDGDAGVIIRSTDEELGTNAYSGYYAGLRTHDGRLVLGRANYGWLESQTAPFPGGIKTQHWYHLEVAAVGCTIAAAATDLSTGARSTASIEDRPCIYKGRIGLRSYSTSARWRSLVVSPADGVTLAAMHATSQPREQTGIYLPLLNAATTADLSDSRTIIPLPDAPLLLRSIGSLRYVSSVDAKPVSIHGTVVLRRPMLFVQGRHGRHRHTWPGSTSLCAWRRDRGDRHTALGDFSLQLRDAKVRVLGPGKPLTPKSVTAAEAATGIYDASS